MTDNKIDLTGSVCPLPLQHREQIVMGHGSGGKMSHDLVAKLFLPSFDNPALRIGDDAAVMETAPGTFFATSIDAHVVWPLFFPGGDIGRLAVCGTVNDVAMSGADPRFLTVGFILEEGLDIIVLQQVIELMKRAAEEAGIYIVAGDTKVVQKGKADGLYITTCGIGTRRPGILISGTQARPGDVIIISGPVGDHGIAVLAARGDLGFESEVMSDVAPLNHMISDMIKASGNIHVLRDPTRGGLATSLNEIANQSQVGMVIHENLIPVRPSVRAACEMLGFDPLYIANEGKLITIAAAQDVDKILEAMHHSAYGKEAVVIGEVTEENRNRVLMKTSIGSTRIVDVLSGELLPRIC